MVGPEFREKVIMRRFFVSPADINEQTATLTGSEAHHLINVLRLKAGGRITLFDGTGTTYEGMIASLEPEVTVDITTINPEDLSRPRLHLAQALIKTKKNELIVQKATELGVDSIVFFTSRYCATDEPSASKQERWQRIAMESCKQCNRPAPPEIRPVISFAECVRSANEHDLKIIFWEETADKNLGVLREKILAEKPEAVFYLIGPEGGLTDEEVALAKEHGFHSVTMGKQILRAETASIAAAAILQFLLGNMD
ncbi:MAG: 16S rRNA (uracil(1498)-N(3))-methyltransferase [Thermodesulfobacteriota bacterium]